MLRRNSPEPRVGLFIAALALACAAGCAKPPKVSTTTPTSGRMTRASVSVSDEIAKKCEIKFGDAPSAPAFDFDEAALTREDRDVLEQVARCVTTGQLRGKRLGLIGRADPRGETEYNMALGARRAESVEVYLANLGVASDAIIRTSRGELDAEGTDEAGYKLDRRVDIVLVY